MSKPFRPNREPVIWTSEPPLEDTRSSEIGTTDAPTANASPGPAPQPLDFLQSERAPDDFERARRHSRKVKLLRIAMPVVGVVLIAGIVGVFTLNQMLTPNLDVDAIKVDDGKLVMQNPTLNGFDANQRPYKLTAARAVQEAANPAQVQLDEISATLPLDESISADVTAGTGFYDANARTLQLDKQVSVVTNDGMTLDLQDADIDMRAGTLFTQNPVRATSAQADISADRLTVEKGGEYMLFTGTVRITLRPGELRKDEEESKQAAVETAQ